MTMQFKWNSQINSHQTAAETTDCVKIPPHHPISGAYTQATV